VNACPSAGGEFLVGAVVAAASGDAETQVCTGAVGGDCAGVGASGAWGDDAGVAERACRVNPPVDLTGMMLTREEEAFRVGVVFIERRSCAETITTERRTT
jgi:hypothetical protein